MPRLGAFFGALLLATAGTAGAGGVAGGPVVMHPAGQAWVEEHGDVAEENSDACKPCHGADLRGTALSRALADRVIDAEDYGEKFFWQGFQIGCYTCHLGPNDESPNPNRAPHVPDVSLETPAGTAVTHVLAAEDPDDDDLELRIVSAPAHGTAEVDGETLRYSPDPGFVGMDELTYAAWDHATDSNLGRVLVTVTTPEPTQTRPPEPTSTETPEPTAPSGATPQPTPSQVANACAGDCDENGQVHVSEIVLAVGIALDGGSVESCAAADGNVDGRIAIDELVRSVRAALLGCDSDGTPAPTRPPLPTPTPTATAVNEPPTASPSPTATVSEPTFEDVRPSFVSAGCTASFCHSRDTRAGGLSLEGSEAYDDLVGVPPSNPAASGAGLSRVAAGDPESSFLLIKLTGPGPGQGAMMVGMSPAQVQAIRDWITSGAVR